MVSGIAMKRNRTNAVIIPSTYDNYTKKDLQEKLYLNATKAIKREKE